MQNKAENTQEYRTLFGAVLQHKPEHMTHLHGNTLVYKDDPRIVFRGQLDFLQAEVLLLIKEAPQASETLTDILTLLRRIMRCDVLNEPLGEITLGGLDREQLREHSHHPERYYNQGHFLPEETDGIFLLKLNRLRTLARQAEITAYRAYRNENGVCTREDILTATNRLSSFPWILIIQCKPEEEVSENE